MKQLSLFPLQKSIIRRDKQRSAIITASGSVLALGLITSVFISRRLSKPVEQLAETLFAASEEKYQSLFENATEGIFVLNTTGSLTRANPSLAKICGLKEPADILALGPPLPVKLFAEPAIFHALLLRLRTKEASPGSTSRSIPSYSTPATISPASTTSTRPDTTSKPSISLPRRFTVRTAGTNSSTATSVSRENHYPGAAKSGASILPPATDSPRIHR